MFDSYTKGMWLEFASDEDFAERDWTTLASRRNTSGGLAKIWSDLAKRKTMQATVRWMKARKGRASRIPADQIRNAAPARYPRRNDGMCPLQR